MINRLAAGLVAGAVGTVALNVTTYLDMTLRGRPSSDVPATTADRLAGMAGVDLTPDLDAQGPDAKRARDAAESRRTGIGALLGYATGLGLGALYGLTSPMLRRVPTPLAALLVGAAAMAGGDVPSATLGATDPRKWGAPGWLADIVPHLVYGAFTALTFRAVAPRSSVARLLGSRR